MSKQRPNIGVTGPDRGGSAAWWFSWFAITIQGGHAIRIRPKTGIPAADIHGLVIGGGADINPKWYGGGEMQELLAKDKEVSGIRQFFIRLATIFFFPIIYLVRKLFSTSSVTVDDARDELEFDLINRAVKKGIPILGICRGAQLLNIHFGGTLHQDIANYYAEVPRVHSVWPKKKVTLDEESTLYQIVNFKNIWVNAMHHQAVDKLGDALKVVAHEESGLVQAIEHQNGGFLMGVQWHPEYMPQIPPQRRIFRELVERGREFANENKGKK